MISEISVLHTASVVRREVEGQRFPTEKASDWTSNTAERSSDVGQKWAKLHCDSALRQTKPLGQATAGLMWMPGSMTNRRLAKSIRCAAALVDGKVAMCCLPSQTNASCRLRLGLSYTFSHQPKLVVISSDDTEYEAFHWSIASQLTEGLII